MADFRKLSDTVLASPQINVDDLAEAKARGVTMIVNNRPDGESPDQPPGSDIEATAKDLGLDYRAIPVDGSGIGDDQVAAMVDALNHEQGTVLAFCRSGTRSTFLWALAQAKSGMPIDEIVAQASAAGYDVGPARPAMEKYRSEAD